MKFFGYKRWIPAWAQTIRFRLTVTYSAVLFGLATLVVAGVYAAMRSNVQARPLDPFTVDKAYRSNGQWQIKPGESIQAADIDSVEAAVNFRTLDLLKNYSLAAIAALFVASLVTGWLLSGRVLRPVRQITTAARHITATDLSRRIELDGPNDELRTLADTLDDMLGRLDGAFAAQRQLVDDASHELRNPLAVIQANVDALLSDDDATPEARAQAAAIVTRATTRMASLVDDLLASARLRSPAFTDADVDLAAVAGEAAEEYALLAAERELTLSRRLSAGPVVAGDPQALRRAVDNLLSNAVRLAPEGSELVLAAGSRAGWAWVAVRDGGPGIAGEDRERIFDRFYRSDSRSPEQRRAGLGLAIVRQIVESHGGAVAVHSAIGVGSTFVLWLPDRAVAGADRRSPAPPADDPLGARPALVRTRAGRA
jgi:signal transduction histidine kinase